jgi:malate dehydrogenase (oxaloacetate-decarboxylating)
MHDDQHGTATVILAGLLGALKVTGKRLEEVSVVIAGAGAAGIASAKLLLEAGITQMAMTDSRGIIAVGREGMNPYKDELAAHINPDGVTGTLADALKGADVFIGVSRPGIVSVDDVRAMAPDPIIFAMSNPVPEIMPDDARAAGAAVVATGRSDFPNQANNVLAFPGIFLGAMEAGAATITPAMRVAAAHALASLVPEPTAERILPSPLDEGVARAVADAVKSAA